MSTAIVQYDAGANVDDLRKIAELLATSEYFDAKGNNAPAIAKLATKVLAGRELGFGPFASVNGIHIIQGRPAIGANLMASAVKASGRYDYRIRKMDAEACEIEFFELAGGKRESVGVSSFTKADATAAGTQNMNKYPRNMLFARAMSNGVKWFCPDVFNGNAVYVPEELGANVDGEGNVIDVQPTVVTQEVKPANKPAAPQAANNSGGSQTSTGNGGGAAGGKAYKASAAALDFLAACKATFGDDDEARHWYITTYTEKKTPGNVRRSTKDMTDAELVSMTGYLTKFPTKYADDYAAHKAAFAAVPHVADAEPIPA